MRSGPEKRNEADKQENWRKLHKANTSKKQKALLSLKVGTIREMLSLSNILSEYEVVRQDEMIRKTQGWEGINLRGTYKHLSVSFVQKLQKKRLKLEARFEQK